MRNDIEKYEAIKNLGKQIFTKSNVVQTGEITQADIEIAKQFLAKAITATNPEVFSLFFEHIFIAPELGSRIAKEIGSRVKGIEVREIEFLLWLHDVGRLVDPGGFLRNDIICDNLLTSFGLPKSLIQKLPNVRTFLQVGRMLELSEKQIEGKENLTADQEKIIADYFVLLTPTQKIVFMADNFGKRDENASLFNLERFLHYVRTQEKRYGNDERWILERRSAGAILTISIVKKTIDWFEEIGIDFKQVLNDLKDYGPKFVLLVRHGDPDNPRNIVYNLDEVMKKEDIIHITDQGKDQLNSLGKVINKRKFRVVKIAYSNQTRAVESAKEIIKELKILDETTEPRLKDLYAPGAYLEGLTMDDWKKKKGNAYDKVRWGKYNHEEPVKLIDRVNGVFWENVNKLNVGQTAILLSHGDPIAWWINNQVMGQIPPADLLRDLIYPNQGQAIVCIIDPQGIFFTHYLLTDPSLIEGESY